MKVLHIINSLTPGGGAEQLIGELLPALKNKGIELYAVTLYKYGDSIIDQKLLENGIYIDKINSPLKYNPLIFVHLQGVLRRGFDIIHTHLFPAQYYGAALITDHRTRFITHEQNTFNRRRKNKLFKILEAKIYAKYDRVLCVSKAVSDSLRAWIPKISNKIEVVYNGRDLTHFNLSKPLERFEIGIPDEVPLVIMVSSLRPQKDHTTLMKAIKKLVGVHLLIVGQGPLKNDLIKLAVNLGIKERIHFLGHRNDVARLIKTADVFVQSSHWEGFALSIIEAMACGVPVIGTDVSGQKELIVDGISGVLVPPKSENSLAASISSILNNRDLNNKLRMGALKRAKEFTIDAVANKVFNIYMRVRKLK